MYEKVVRVPHSGWDLTFLFHELQDAAGEASALYHASSDDLAAAHTIFRACCNADIA